MSQSSASENLRKNVRKFIFEHFEENATAPVLEQIMRKFRLDRISASKVLEELQSARHISLLPGTQRILMAFPFSGIVTPFRVKVNGKDKEYFANCAWDAVAIHVKEQKVVPQQTNNSPLIYLALPASKWWENIVLTCSNNMVFFGSKEHLAQWTHSNSQTRGEALTIEQTLKLSIPIYKNKMTLDYGRPSRGQTIAHFQSLGLTGDFWKI